MIVIVGAGPGGTSAAISAAINGFQVVIVDAAAFPRDRPGETLHPGIQPLAARLGVEARLLSAGFLRHEGTWIEWNGHRRFEPFGRYDEDDEPWRGFQAWRADFDSMLLDRARELGVCVRQPCRALKPLVEDGRVMGVESSGGCIPAQFVIDATGGTHWIARRLGVSIERHSPKLLARFGYESECKVLDEELPEIIADEHGWTWRARIGPRHYTWTRLLLDSASEVSTACEQKGADVTWRCVASPAGLGYFCVGDAACVVDPASSHGVLRAVMSGMMAADVVRKITADPTREMRLLADYNQWINEWFSHDTAELRRSYSQLPNPPSWAVATVGRHS